MFVICGALYIFGLVVYVIFGSGEEQQWAKIESTTVKKDVTSSYELEQQYELRLSLKDNEKL